MGGVAQGHTLVCERCGGRTIAKDEPTCMTCGWVDYRAGDALTMVEERVETRHYHLDAMTVLGYEEFDKPGWYWRVRACIGEECQPDG